MFVNIGAVLLNYDQLEMPLLRRISMRAMNILFAFPRNMEKYFRTRV